MRSLLTLFALSLTSSSFGAIGPSASVFIENANIAPDGFTRSYVSLCRLVDERLLKLVAPFLLESQRPRQFFLDH